MKMLQTLFLSITVLLSIGGCKTYNSKLEMLKREQSEVVEMKAINRINDIPAPEGYEKIVLNENSFGSWLRLLSLRKNNTVYLYDGALKANQSWHYRVIDISTGNKNLQQCADAIMRLRAEYYFSQKAYDKIVFYTGDGTKMSFVNYAKGERYAVRSNSLKSYQSGNQHECYSNECLLSFLENVFGYCGTYTIKDMTDLKAAVYEIAPGDVFVTAGSPGHAMMVADVAVNKKTGKKAYMLLQGFMPAQDIHIVHNLNNKSISPWYELNPNEWVNTPGKIFALTDLRQWR